MRFSVGLPKMNPGFVEDIILCKDSISEVYFAWGDFASGRSNGSDMYELTEWERQTEQVSYLDKLSQNGIPFNLLFNANCYGAESQSRALFNKIGTTVDFVQSKYKLNSITTTSPLIAKFIKNNFEGLEVRSSVNMEIGTREGMDYLAEYFDGYYMKREYNRDFDKIKELRAWCDQRGKKLYLLANSGCLNFCSAHNFHDNLVAHESEISKMDNAYNFTGICKEYLSNPENYGALITNTNFIRPEDIHKYEGYFDGIKLATRVNKNPSQILKSYVRQKYSGNILELLEPAHSIYPYVLENGEELKLVKIDTTGGIIDVNEQDD